jgi:hypothetical protein
MWLALRQTDTGTFVKFGFVTDLRALSGSARAFAATSGGCPAP